MIIKPTCPTRDQIENLLIGELSPCECELFWQHIDDCQNCYQLVNSNDLSRSDRIEALRDTGSTANPAQSTFNSERLKLIPSVLKSVGETPRQLGPYELLTEIARGGMGVVYLAQQIRFGRKCAVKLLSAFKTRDLVERYKKEIQAVGQLEHPSIVRALDAGSIDGE